MLSQKQMEELRKVLTHTLQNVEISERKALDIQKIVDNEELLNVFITAKRIEGCSEKSLKYYDSTLRNPLGRRDYYHKPVRQN